MTNSTPHSPKKNRYRTPIPYEAQSLDNYSPKKDTPQSALQKYDSITPPSQRSPEEGTRSSIDSWSSPNTTNTSTSEGIRAVVDTDSWLPYSRRRRALDLTQLSDQLEEINGDTTFLRKKSSNAAIRLAQDGFQTRPPLPVETCQRSSSLNTAGTRDIHVDDSELQKETRKPFYHRTQPTQPPPRVSSLEGSRVAADKFDQRRSRGPPLNLEDAQRRKWDVTKPKIPERHAQRQPPETSLYPKRPIPTEQRSCSARPANPRIYHETVQGVTMDARPQSSIGQDGGMSIPEIEARDIRQIPGAFTEANADDDYVSEYDSQRQHYARFPPPIGGRQNQTRAISPRPAMTGAEHTFVCGYSSRDEESSIQDHFQPRFENHDQSLFVAGPTVAPQKPPSTILEQQEEEEEEDAAEPPTIARIRALEEQDQETTSKTHQAKSLVKNMLKGFSSSKHDDENDRTSPDKPPHRVISTAGTGLQGRRKLEPPARPSLNRHSSRDSSARSYLEDDSDSGNTPSPDLGFHFEITHSSPPSGRYSQDGKTATQPVMIRDEDSLELEDDDVTPRQSTYLR